MNNSVSEQGRGAALKLAWEGRMAWLREPLQRRRGKIAASALGMRFPLSEAFLSLLANTPQHMTVYFPSYFCR